MILKPVLSFAVFLIATAFAAAEALPIAEPPDKEWWTWRGPRHNGHAEPSQKPPTTWSETENVVWKTEIPGRGHGSPILVHGKIYLPSANEKEQRQIVICIDATTGGKIWKQVVHEGNCTFKNDKASLASATAASDGERLYVNFHNAGAVHATALDFEGNKVWQTKIADYELHQGFGASPAVHGPLVVFSADNKSGGAIVALRRTNGEVAWRADRPKKPNYTSPIVVTAAGKEQMIFSGCDLVTSFNPDTGEKLWEISGATTECVTSAVTDGKLVFTSGGYPDNHVSAIRADGSGEVAWRNNSRVYVPSMLVKDGYLYAVTDAGVAICWECATGKEAWKGRLGGTFSSSPVLVKDTIYVTNEAGKTYLFAADPAKFTLLGSNQLGDEVFATPTICGGRIYMRVAVKKDVQRQEWLYCLGEPR